ncbi:MAG: hypothetical protein R3264_15155 [Anaerolineae bacterium]|nr:hypothetical protein [Anaerolineae bacterium]
MTVSPQEAKALFLAPDGNIYPDTLICSGIIPAQLNGEPCVFSKQGRLPDPEPLDPKQSGYSIDQGQPNDLCPPCAKQNLSNLGHWQGHDGQTFPAELLPLRLFKCRQWLWLVVPGLFHDDPTQLQHLDDTQG